MRSALFQKLVLALHRTKVITNVQVPIHGLSFSCSKGRLLQNSTSKYIGLIIQPKCCYSLFVGNSNNVVQSFGEWKPIHQSCQCLANRRNKTKKNEKKNKNRAIALETENHVIPTKLKIQIVKETDMIKIFSPQDMLMGVCALAEAK